MFIKTVFLILVDTNGSDNSIPMAYLTLDHQLQVHTNTIWICWYDFVHQKWAENV